MGMGYVAGEPRWHHFRRGGVNGLSPLARGTLNFPGADSFQIRFIPADAGNTFMTY